MADPESLRRIAHSPAPFSTWLGIVLLFALFGAIVLAVIGPSQRGSDYEQTRAAKRLERLKSLREETEKELTTYAWVDKSKGIARIPIDRAMELTVAELAQKKPAPAGPIATPPGSASSPAGSASPSASAPPPGGSRTPAAGQPPASHGNSSGSLPPTQPGTSPAPAAQSSPAALSPSPSPTPLTSP
jgi:hypothetical protein